MDPEVDPEAVIASARGDVDERLLTGTDGGFLSRDVLADDPLVAYLRDGEALQYLLAGAAAPTRIRGDETRPVETAGSYRTLLAVTDRRVLVVAGSGDGDRAFSLPYDRLHGVERASGLLTDTVVVMESPDRGLEVPVGTGSDPAAAVSYARGRLANAGGTSGGSEPETTGQPRGRPGEAAWNAGGTDAPDASTGRADGRDRTVADVADPPEDVTSPTGSDAGPDPITDPDDEQAPADAARDDADSGGSDGGSSLLGFLGLGSTGDDSPTDAPADADEPTNDAPAETDEPPPDAGREGRASEHPGDSREQPRTPTGVDRIPDAGGGRGDVREAGSGGRPSDDVREAGADAGDFREAGSPGDATSYDAADPAGGSGRRITVAPSPGAADASPVAGEFVDVAFDALVTDADLGVQTYGGLDALVDDLGARHRRMRERLDAGDFGTARTVAAAADGLAAELERLADERGRTKLRRRAAATRKHVRRRFVAAVSDVDPETLEDEPGPALLAVLQRVDPYDFEHLVADLWTELGYQTAVTQSSQDQGIDVVARRATPVEQTVLIQAKRYGPDTKVGREEVQQYASLHRQEPDADLVVVVTTGAFTAPAREAAGELNVKLVDGDRLVDLVADEELFDVVAGYVGDG